MSSEEIIIAVVTAVLVVFSLVVSLVIPNRDPGFPGKRGLVAFGAVVILLVGGTLATIEVLGAPEEGEAAAVEGGTEGAAPAETGAAPAETGAAAEAGGAEAQGDPAAGKQVFASAGCAACHTLADAGAAGAVGPNLDEAKPDHALVVDRVTNGKGAMPAFAGQLSDEDIQNVAAYVVQATSG